MAVVSVGAAAIAVTSLASAYGAFQAAAEKALEGGRIAALSSAYLSPGAGTPPPALRQLPSPAVVLSRQPLASDVLARAGFEASLRGDAALAGRLMTEVMRRDPRSQPVRLWWLAKALKHDDINGAVAQIDRLMAFGSSESYFPILAELARQRRAERPLAALLATNPPWRDQFLGFLTTRDVGSDLIFRLTTNGSPPATPQGASVQSALIDKFITKGDYDRAYLAWINFLPESAMGSVASVYDGGFVGLPGPAPFNWSFSDGEAASVGIEQHRGLQIDYPSAKSVQMARQLLVLKPGSYRLDYVASGSGETNDGGVISWHLGCANGKVVMPDLPIKDLTDRPAARAVRFAVPAGCPAQLLSIEGTAGNFPKTRTVSIARVAISMLR